MDGAQGLHTRLAVILPEIERHDTDYPRRYALVLEAMALAAQIGFRNGFAWDTGNAEAVAHRCRIVAYIDLPSGQVSWHLPEYAGTWDRHTTDEKYLRCRTFTASVFTPHG